MRPVDAIHEVTQGFASMATQGVAPSWTPNTVGWYVRLYGNYQPFGHAGVDIGCPIGTRVYAMAAGRVVWADWGSNLPGDESWGSLGYFRRWAFYKNFPGILTVIHHPQLGPHVYTAYAHLSTNDAAPIGTQVKEGQLIGLSGNTGGVAPHLHIEKLVDPTYSTGNGLIYGRADPVSMFGKPSPAAPAKPKPKGLFVSLTPAQEKLILDRITKYIDSPISQVDEKSAAAVWATTVKRTGGNVSALQELADNKTIAVSLQGRIAGLENAITQMAARPGSPVDLTAVAAAAEEGATKALSTLRITNEKEV